MLVSTANLAPFHRATYTRRTKSSVSKSKSHAGTLPPEKKKSRRKKWNETKENEICESGIFRRRGVTHKRTYFGDHDTSAPVSLEGFLFCVCVLGGCHARRDRFPPWFRWFFDPSLHVSPFTKKATPGVGFVFGNLQAGFTQERAGTVWYTRIA